MRQLADVHRLEEASAVGTRVSAVGASGRRVRWPLWSVPLYKLIYIYYILSDGDRYIRVGTTRGEYTSASTGLGQRRRQRFVVCFDWARARRNSAEE